MPLSAFLIESRIKKQAPIPLPGSRTEVTLSSPETNEAWLQETSAKVELPEGHHGPLHYESEYFLLPKGGAYRSSSPSGWVLHNPPEVDGYSLYIPRSGTLSWQNGADVIDCHGGSGILLDLAQAQMQQIACSSQSSGQGFFFSRHGLTLKLSMLLDAPVHRQLHFHSPLVQAPHLLAPLTSLIDIVAQGLVGAAPLKHAPLAMANLLQAASYLILHNLPHNHSDALARHPAAPAPRQIKRAVEFIIARLSAPITLVDIAQHAAISVRSLQSGFRKYRQMTPMEYLRTQRLARVREDLLDPAIPPEIPHIALSWGFTHLYLFMRYYKKQFGESPQATLGRRKVK